VPVTPAPPPRSATRRGSRSASSVGCHRASRIAAAAAPAAARRCRGLRGRRLERDSRARRATAAARAATSAASSAAIGDQHRLAIATAGPSWSWFEVAAPPSSGPLLQLGHDFRLELLD
jgi:hypothetical protein